MPKLSVICLLFDILMSLSLLSVEECAKLHRSRSPGFSVLLQRIKPSDIRLGVVSAVLLRLLSDRSADGKWKCLSRVDLLLGVNGKHDSSSPTADH